MIAEYSENLWYINIKVSDNSATLCLTKIVKDSEILQPVVGISVIDKINRL